MKQNLLFITLLFLLSAIFGFGQIDHSSTTVEETKAYSQAIAEYIKAVNKKDKLFFDTLFIGKHEDFPDINLPASLENTKIISLTSEEANKKLTYRNLVYLNVIGNISKDHSNFIIVTFNVSKQKSYIPKHNCLMDLRINLKTNEPELVRLKFDLAYSTEK